MPAPDYLHNALRLHKRRESPSDMALRKHIGMAVDKYGFKVLYMGDPAKLPPVKELESPIWKVGVGTVLTKVMRHDNEILELVTRIRNVVAPLLTVSLWPVTWRVSTPLSVAVCVAPSWVTVGVAPL